MKALIVGSGSLFDSKLLKDRYNWADLVIAADGGAAYLVKAGFLPHILMGDLDSVPEAIVNEVRLNNRTEIITYPVEKDYTDMELAIDLAIERGAGEIVILGGTGSRLDHTTANIHLLYKLMEKGVKGFLENENNKIYLVKDELTIKKQVDRKVSLLPLPPCVKGITTEGLSYVLYDATLKFGTGIGISNEFSDEYASVKVKEGLLLVFISKD